MDRIKNYHITHKEVGNKVFFLRKLAKGGSKHSFGIHVAKMAGIPTITTFYSLLILSKSELSDFTTQKTAYIEVNINLSFIHKS